MTEASLSGETLRGLQACRKLALQNLKFYVCLYDSIEDSSDREAIGMAMTQKEAFLGAIDAILNNHDVSATNDVWPTTKYDCEDILSVENSGHHLEQEEAFQRAIKKCIKVTRDEALSELLAHHLEAADIALTAIKASSLKL